MSKDEVVFWDVDGQEILRYDDLEEAIEMILGDCPKPLPLKLEICGYKRTTVTLDKDQTANYVSEHILEHLDENYGGEEPITEVDDIHKYFLSHLLQLWGPLTVPKATVSQIMFVPSPTVACALRRTSITVQIQGGR